MTPTNADLERIHEAEAALGRGDRTAALSALTDLSAFDAPIMEAMSATYDGDLDAAVAACQRAIAARGETAPLAA